MFTRIYEKIKQFMKENYKGLIAILIIFLVFTIELPYSIYSPGGAVNLNKRINVDNGYESKGSFNMAYVSMVKGSLPFILISKVIPDWDLVKKSELTAKGEDMEELLERERLYLEESIDNATINAYKKAGKSLSITKTISKVSYIANDAKTDIKVGDEIVSINGDAINGLPDLKRVVEALEKDTKVSIKIKRDDRLQDASATTFEIDGITKIGISIVTTYEYDTNPNITVKSKSSEAGSSGGLMMSLSIYNNLVEEDITHGKKIVGTGTIDIDGNVGEIGGVKYKLIGAVKNKAEIFICPEENYEEAKKVKEERDFKIDIISVKTFDEALKKLEEI